ncbi:MAG: folate-binding protein YgfZ [Gammaproteobacteria bacterium]|jgi:folate-binding protein YgfZ
MSPIWKDFLSSQAAEFKDDRLLTFKGNEINESSTINNIVTDLSHLAIIEVSGDDSEDFLHGQFTINIKELTNNYCQFSAWCNPKGQVKATFLIYRNDNNFTILLPAELKGTFVKQLQMFVLRANVNISDKSDELIRIGVQMKDDTTLSNLIDSVPEQLGDVTFSNDIHCLRITSNENVRRFILIGSADRQIELWKEFAKHVTPVGTSLWELLDLQTAYPWVTTETTQKFLPQMLNMDLIDGLNYQKGCYPGQEIIARLHFRGQLKRSLCLATTALDSRVISGDQLYDSDKSIGTVINAQAANDKYYLLAVIDIDSREKKISLGNSDGPLLSLLQLPYGNN